MATKMLGELLVDTGVLTQPQLQLALREQSRNGRLLGEILEQLGYATKIQIVRALATQGGVPHIDLRKVFFEPGTLEMFNPSLLKSIPAIPLWASDTTLSIATSDPSNTLALDRLREVLKKDIFVYGADEEEIRHFINRMCGDVPTGEGGPLVFTRKRNEEDMSPMERTALRTFHQVMTEGIRKRATDILFEPDGSVLRIRFRTDSGMSQGPILLHTYHAFLFDVLRQFLHMNPVGDAPQEGDTRAIYLNREFDLRVSILPTIQGAMASIRPIEKGSTLLSIERLGLLEEPLAFVRNSLSRPSGVILVVGPAGSGRTTSLYAFTLEANSIDKNVTTIEESVEVQLAHINQIGLDAARGIEMAPVLRQLVRRRPDVIMISELRDRESVELVLRAAANGSLIIAGLSASDAAEALSLLLKMGVDPFYLGYSLNTIVAQRLVRRICSACRESYTAPATEVGVSGSDPKSDVTLFRGHGCSQCAGTGYSGSVGVFEVFDMTDEVRKSLDRNLTPAALRQILLDRGCYPLIRDGLEKAKRGMTSIEEVRRVLR